MLSYIARRLIYFIPTLILISIIGFVVINLPPGDYLSVRLLELRQRGDQAAKQRIKALKERYSLDEPLYVQYFNWITNFVTGDFGESFQYKEPVSNLIWDRLGYTVLLSLSTMFFTWAVAIPIGVYCASNQYSIGDYIFSVIGFIGLSIPNFLLALVLLVLGVYFFDNPIGGLFSPQYMNASWSLGKFIDLLKHLWIPVIVVGTAGTAEMIRMMRANMLEVLGKQYIETARAKGLKESKVTWKYAVRMAINPIISTVGMNLPRIISGATIVSIVLGMPTTGPLYLEALKNQDMFLAGSFLMFLSILLLIGNLLADIVLAWVDPRIRYDEKQ